MILHPLYQDQEYRDLNNMNIPTLENDVYDICVKQFINSSNIFETSKINYIEFSHRFIYPLKYQLIIILIDIKPSM